MVVVFLLNCQKNDQFLHPLLIQWVNRNQPASQETWRPAYDFSGKYHIDVHKFRGIGSLAPDQARVFYFSSR